jgi:glucuronide carrier protein
MFGAVPLLFMSILIFRTGELCRRHEDHLRLCHVCDLGTHHLLVNIPYGSLASAVAQSVHERAKLVAARAFGAGIGGVVVTSITGGFINDLRGRMR